VWLRYGKKLKRWWKEWRKKRRGPRQLHPKEPADCPDCARGIHWLTRKPKRDVVPWSERKSRRGRKKQIDTHGHACLNPRCDYFGIIDAAIHALVGDGKRGKDKYIQYFRCQCCGQRRTSRYGTPLYHLKTAEWRVSQVLTALAEGVDMAAASRIFGHHPRTIGNWLTRAGHHSQRFHDRLFHQRLEAYHIQLDELVTKVRRQAERLWVWTAIDAHTKIIPAFHIGGRKTDDACHLVHQLAQRLKSNVLPVFTSDGLNQYYYALTAHWGFWDKPPRARKQHWFPDPRLLYAQLRKKRSGYRVKFTYPLFQLGDKQTFQHALQALGLTGTVQTSYIERSNLTLRELVSALSRRTWSLAYDAIHLERHLHWGLAYYHLCRPHLSLTHPVRGPSRYRYRTPLMAAGITRRRWSVDAFLHLPIPEQVATDLALVL
jgi:IS1 family transposase